MLTSPLLTQDRSGEDPDTRDALVPAQSCCMGCSGSLGVLHAAGSRAAAVSTADSSTAHPH